MLPISKAEIPIGDMVVEVPGDHVAGRQCIEARLEVSALCHRLDALYGVARRYRHILHSKPPLPRQAGYFVLIIISAASGCCRSATHRTIPSASLGKLERVASDPGGNFTRVLVRRKDWIEDVTYLAVIQDESEAL
jgi:hypothetical protein